jgi:hypothetical protein
LEEEDNTWDTTTLTPYSYQILHHDNNIPSKQYIVNYPDGRYLGVVKLDSSFKKNREVFHMSKCQHTVIYHKKKAMNTTLDLMEDTNKIFN